MAKPNRLQELEQEHHTPLAQLIPQTVNTLGTQQAAAAALGISQTTISTWLKENGYAPKTIYVKKGESQNEEQPVVAAAG